ncbi:MAG: hypothetical protein WC329_00610 [Candidatus Omnitrophota bacterium]|jgi:V/A-type H+-transporting ATPase subunit I
MAVSSIKKIDLIGLERDRMDILSFLQNRGQLEIISSPAAGTAQPGVGKTAGAEPMELEDAISFLGAYSRPGGVFSKMLKQRVMISAAQLRQEAAAFDVRAFLDELNKFRLQYQELQRRKERFNQERIALMPWRFLETRLDDLRNPSSLFGVFLGTVDLREKDNLLRDISGGGAPAHLEIVNTADGTLYAAVVYLAKNFERIEGLLKGRKFNFVVLGAGEETVRERLLEVNIESLILDDKMQDIRGQFCRMSEQALRLMLVHDYLLCLRERMSVSGTLEKQAYTFSLCAWARRKDIPGLEEELYRKFPESAVFLSDPFPGENIPSALENRPLLQPFEVVTDLYGKPVYGGIDPSGLLAPFFLVSFGFCIADAGYGLLILAAAAFLFSRRPPPPEKIFLRLMVWMGIFTVIAGMITGGFFGDLIGRLPESFAWAKRLQRKLAIIDPVKDSMLFLGATLIFGFLQVACGVAVKFCRDLKRDRFAAFALDLPSLFVQFSMLGLCLVFTGMGPAWLAGYALYSFVAAGALIVFYNWRSNKDISLKIFWSGFGLYSIVTGNFLSDTLSFSRIFALGLTGSLLGAAINTMLFPSGPVNGIGGIIGAAAAVGVLFAAHILNMAISLLGAYVHTSRLQYLEFFGKFFEAGGRPFRAFRQEGKYTYITTAADQTVRPVTTK